MKKIGITMLMAMMSMAMSAQQCILEGVTYGARLGYNLGGTAPVGLPATIRKLSSYELTPSFQAGIDAERPLGRGIGVLVGLHVENKGMNVDAQVKNYHMQISKGTQVLEGQFTGYVKTEVSQWMVSLPIQATWHPASAWRLRFGPYVSYVLSGDFSGYAHEGYLRVGNPTGAKVNIGSEAGQRGDYDFSPDLRRFQLGLSVGADWNFYQRLGCFVELNWGLTGIHRSDFKTIEQTLYPIYASVGLSYKLN